MTYFCLYTIILPAMALCGLPMVYTMKVVMQMSENLPSELPQTSLSVGSAGDDSPLRQMGYAALVIVTICLMVALIIVSVVSQFTLLL